MMAKRQVDALNEGGVDVPPLQGQDVRDLSQSPEHHAVPHADQAAAAVRFDDLS